MIQSKHILVIIGTRPEAIKMAPVIHALRKANFQTSVCITAQHRSMLDQVLSFFSIQPDYDLDLMMADQTLNGLASKIISGIDEVLTKVKPNLVIVHGDTTTSSMAALSAFHGGISVGHVEAGLRTYRKDAPFPEEVNRQLTARIADYHFAPTPLAKQNLINEQIPEAHILVTGNTVIDALLDGLQRIEQGAVTSDLELVKNKYDGMRPLVLITGHRRENFGSGFEELCRAILHCAQTHQHLDWVYPVHLNPNVQQPVKAILNNQPNIHLLDPVDYPAFIYLMKRCSFILTDSGGIQEEAPSLGKPVLVMREATERPEGIASGNVMLTGNSFERITEACNRLITDNHFYAQMSKPENPFGDGLASMRIVNFIAGL